MAQYRKKPIVIEAVQMTPEMRHNYGPFPEWAIPHLSASQTEKIDNSECVSIKTLEGEMRVSDYDFIIQGVNGECYPCKPDIFGKTYEAV